MVKGDYLTFYINDYWALTICFCEQTRRSGNANEEPFCTVGENVKKLVKIYYFISLLVSWFAYLEKNYFMF